MVRICIAGKNNIAVEAVEYLLKRGLSNEEIVVTCNRSKIGRIEWQRNLADCARQNHIREVPLSEVYEMQDIFFLSLEYDQLIHPERFQTEKLFNIHFSNLPKYKGMYTSAMTILNNESETGVTFHYIDSGIDTGDIIAQKVFPIEPEDTSRDVYKKCIRYGVELCKEMLERFFFREENVIATPQDPNQSTYYSKKSIDYEHLSADLVQTALGIKNQVRAFFFPEYQVLPVYGKPIEKAVISKERSKEKPGTILNEDEEKMTIATIDYNIELYYYKGEQNGKDSCDKGLQRDQGTCSD